MEMINAKFTVGEKVIVARTSPGDPAARDMLNYAGKVVGHSMPYALVDFGGAGMKFILERDLERYLG